MLAADQLLLSNSDVHDVLVNDSHTSIARYAAGTSTRGSYYVRTVHSRARTTIAVTRRDVALVGDRER